MTVYDRILDPSQPPIVVAEAGINHNGDMRLARQLVRDAASVGADVIKFQTHLPEHEMVRGGPTAGYVGEPLYDLLSRMVLTEEDHGELIDLAAAEGCTFLSTPFSVQAVDMLDRLGVEMFKVGSGEATNPVLLRHIASKEKPLMVSSGMTTLEELDESVDLLRSLDASVVLLHCTSTYPTAYPDVRLPVIRRMQERYVDIPIGLSDHSAGLHTAIAAVALGARVIEKHFTGSREWEGPDQMASIEPGELAELVRGVRAVHSAMQVEDKLVLDLERETQRMARESVVSARDLELGDLLDERAVTVKRPGTGIPAREYTSVLGRRVRRRVPADTVLSWDDLD